MMNRLAAVMVVMVMGLTAFGAKAQADNLSVEVRVTITGTVNLTWATGAGVGFTGGTGVTQADGGSADNTADSTVDDSTGANDDAVWTIANPDLDTSYDTTTLGARLFLDNIGRKKLKVTATCPAAQHDLAGTWKLGQAKAVSIAALEIKSSSAATGGTGDASSFVAYTHLGKVDPTKTDAQEPPVTVQLAENFRKQHQFVKVDLRYTTPTDITANTEFDTAHRAVVTIVGQPD